MVPSAPRLDLLGQRGIDALSRRARLHLSPGAGAGLLWPALGLGRRPVQARRGPAAMSVAWCAAGGALAGWQARHALAA